MNGLDELPEARDGRLPDLPTDPFLGLLLATGQSTTTLFVHTRHLL